MPYAASRTVAPVLEPLPPAESVADPIAPVPSAAAIAATSAAPAGGFCLHSSRQSGLMSK